MPKRNNVPEYASLARVRRSLRALNAAIRRGAELAGLTLQQQAFLLALAAYGGRDVPLSDVREELEMDQATASELLRRLVRLRFVTRTAAVDRRAIRLALTRVGWTTFRRSVRAIRDEVRRAEHRSELVAMRTDLDRYLRYYLRDVRDRSPAVSSRGSGRRKEGPAR